MWVQLVLFVVVVLAYVYQKVKATFAHWDERGIPFVPPQFPFGNISRLAGDWHYTDLIKRGYRMMKKKHPIMGGFCFLRPAVLILDLDLLKRICSTDFHNFDNRALYYNEKEPLSVHLVSLEGAKWRNIRAKLTPTFSSGKIKMMFPLVQDVGAQLKKAILDKIGKGEVIKMEHISNRYTTDVIGTCAFGFNCNTLADQDQVYTNMCKRVFESPIMLAKIVFTTAFVGFSRKLGLRFFPKDISDFFTNVIRETIAYRQTNKIERMDFMDLVMNLRRHDYESNEDADKEDGKLTFNEIVSASFSFFLAGYETTSCTLTFAMYELARNMEIQEKARDAVREIAMKNDGKITYELISGKSYLDMCINETMRKFPPFGVTTRRVNADYQIPGTKYLLEKDTILILPIHAIHHDRDLYPNPEVFDPERFTPEECAKRHPYAYMPFGAGPRICIGMRFAMMELKVALAVLLRNFRFTLAVDEPIKFSKISLTLSPSKGVPLRMEPLEDSF